MTSRRKLSGALALLFFLLCAAATSVASKPPAEVVTLDGRVEPAAVGQAQVRVSVEIASGFHINAHQPDEPYLVPTTLKLSAGDVVFDAPVYPKPESQRFAFAPDKPLLVYSGTIEITAFAKQTLTAPVRAELRYQACDDTRCLAPKTVSTTIAGEPVAAAAISEAPPVSGEPSLLAGWLAGASLPTAIGMMLVLGLALNLTPCVYPLISVTLGYFGSQPERRASIWPLAGAYVLGITLSFAVLGVTAALAGGLFGAPLQHPAVLIGLAGLLVALALSSFGAYEIRPPHALVNRFGAASAGVGGALLMGLTMGLVAAPCIGPVVLGLLLYVGSERNVLKGFLLFFSMGLGMGLPYVLLASAAGSLALLPRAGEWLRWMNRFFGVLLLGMALYFVSPLLDATALKLIVPIYVAAAGVYLGFLEPSARALRGFTLGRRAFGAVALLAAIWLAIPGGASEGIRWEPLSVKALDRAIAARRPALVEFGADWCLPCVEMERSTFVDPEVTRAAQSFTTLQADVTESTPANDALLERFQVVGVPTLIVYDSTGREVERVVGFVDGSRLSAMLARARERGSRPPSKQPRSEPPPTTQTSVEAPAGGRSDGLPGA